MKRLVLTLALGAALAGLVPAADAQSCRVAGCLLATECGGSDASCPICIYPEKPISGEICTP